MMDIAICAALFGLAAILISVAALMTMFMLDCQADRRQDRDKN